MSTMWTSLDVVGLSARDALSVEKVRARRRLRSTRRRASRPELQHLEIRRLITSVTVNLTGLADWTDSAGGVHAAPMVFVEFRNLADPVNPVPLATANADIAGNFAKSFNVTLGAGNAIDVFARIYTRNPSADVKPDTGAGASTYFMDTASIHVTAGGTFAFPTKIATNTNVGDKAFSIVAATLEASSYAVQLAIPLRKMPSQLDVRYPDAANGASFFDPTTKQLHITARRVLDWDVIQHEFGHYFMDLYAIDATAGGNHSFGASNPKPPGAGLAWNEGFASWFAIMAQRTINAPYAAGVPSVGNTKYDPTGGPVADFATATGAGELDELSVASALYHLAVGDQGIKISDKTLFNTAQTNSVKTFGAEWLNLAKSRPGTDRVKIAHVLGLQKIAPVETGPADFARVTAANVPTFTWTANGSNDFQIQFFTPDLKTVVFTTPALGNVTTYTPAAADWAKIFDGHSTVKWVVEGRDTTAPATPGSVADAVYAGNLTRYWSEARTLNGPSIALVIDNTGSMSNEINAVIASLNQFITNLEDSLLPGEDPPTVELVIFVDAPALIISSDDLNAVKAAVDAMTASGGGDTPEPSAVSLQFAANDIAPGGTILLVTDAPSDPGTDLTGTIAQLRAKGVTVNADISGDSGTIEPSIVAAPAASSPASSSAPASTPTSSTSTTYAAGASFTPFDASVSDGPEPVQSDITDPGQTPIALAGSTTATASPLIVDGAVQEGNVGYLVAAPDGSTSTQTDSFYSMQLIAGVAYNIPIYTGQGQYIQARLLDTDGTTVLQNPFTNIGDLGFGATTIQFTPKTSGTYFLDIAEDFGAADYTLQVSDSPIVGATSSYTLFSTAATQTGGQFLYKPNIANFPSADDTTDFKAGILNVLDSTFEPVVLSSNPLTAPAGTTISLHLTGRKTNWINGKTTLAFTSNGTPVSSITIRSLVVDSPTTLDVTIAVDPAAAKGFVDVTATTQLGSNTETAVGSNVVQLTSAITSPTLLQVLPGSLARGQSATLTIRGTLTNWDSTSNLTLGPGVTIVSQHVDSPTQITAQITVDPAAALGFRRANVSTSDTFSFDTQDMAIMILANALVGVPAITALSLSSASQGQAVDVALTGSSTNFVRGVTTASFGAGITVTGVDVTDSTHAVAHIVVDSASTIGFRDITVTTGTENAVLLGGFLVSAALPVTFTGPAAPVAAPLPFLSTINAVFTVSIPSPLASNATIHYATADGSAIAGKDYAATAGTVTIPAGQTTATILVPLLAHSATNAALTFTLNLTNPSGGISLPNASQTATIAARTVVAKAFVKGSLTYTSSTGKPITLTLAGPGTGIAYFVNGAKDPADVAINASKPTSSLTISGANPLIGGIGINGAIASINAASARLAGDIVVTGALSNLTLGAPTAAAHNITLSGPAATAVSLNLKSANNFTISSKQPIASLLATTFTTGALSAPSAALINITGAMGASLTIPKTIALFHAGTITGGTWTAGTVTALSAGTIAAPFHGLFAGSIGAINVNALAGLLGITGALTAATITGNLSATITAASAGNITVTGNTSGASLRTRANITNFSTGGFLNSTLFAGVDPTVNTLPTIAGNFNNLHAAILNLTVKNTKGYRNSLVSAPTITTATINGAGPNAGGFSARSIGKLTFTQPGHAAVTFSTTKKPIPPFPTLPGTNFKPTVIA